MQLTRSILHTCHKLYLAEWQALGMEGCAIDRSLFTLLDILYMYCECEFEAFLL